MGGQTPYSRLGYNGGERRNDKMVFELHYAVTTGCDRNAFELLQIDILSLRPCVQHICDGSSVTLVIVVTAAAVVVVVVVIVSYNTVVAIVSTAVEVNTVKQCWKTLQIRNRYIRIEKQDRSEKWMEEIREVSEGKS